MKLDSIKVRWEANVPYDYQTIAIEDLDCETREEFEALDDATKVERISAILDAHADLYAIPIIGSIRHT